MTTEELIAAIEGSSVGARLAASSRITTFIRGVRTQPEVNELEAILQVDKRAIGSVVGRVEQLSKREVDIRRANPYDIPLAVYLWLLDQADRASASVEAARVGEVANLRWARMIADRIRETRRIIGSTDLTVVGQLGTTSPKAITHSRESLLRSRLAIGSTTVGSSVNVNGSVVQVVAGTVVFGALATPRATAEAFGTANWPNERAA
jgi:hypothetical protein